MAAMRVGLVVMVVGGAALAACGGQGGTAGGEADAGPVDGGIPACAVESSVEVSVGDDERPVLWNEIVTSPDGEIETMLQDSTRGYESLWYMTVRDGAWSEPEPVVEGVVAFGGWSLLHTADGTLHAVYSLQEVEDGRSDLYYRHRSASGDWSAEVNLTAWFESEIDQDATDPHLVVGPDGALEAAYVSAAVGAPGEVRVLQVGDQESAGTVPILSTELWPGCGSPKTAFDGDGNLHVVADCGDWYERGAYHAVRMDGAWRPAQWFAAIDGSAKLVTSASGQVHVMWNGREPCEPEMFCYQLDHALVAPDGVAPLAPVIGLTHQGLPGSRIAAGEDGRLAIVYGGRAELVLNELSAAGEVAPVCRVSLDESSRGQGTIDPMALHLEADGSTRIVYSMPDPDEDLDAHMIDMRITAPR